MLVSDGKLSLWHLESPTLISENQRAREVIPANLLQNVSVDDVDRIMISLLSSTMSAVLQKHNRDARTILGSSFGPLGSSRCVPPRPKSRAVNFRPFFRPERPSALEESALGLTPAGPLDGWAVSSRTVTLYPRMKTQLFEGFGPPPTGSRVVLLRVDVFFENAA